MLNCKNPNSANNSTRCPLIANSRFHREHSIPRNPACEDRIPLIRNPLTPPIAFIGSASLAGRRLFTNDVFLQCRRLSVLWQLVRSLHATFPAFQATLPPTTFASPDGDCVYVFSASRAAGHMLRDVARSGAQRGMLPAAWSRQQPQRGLSCDTSAEGFECLRGVAAIRISNLAKFHATRMNE